MDQLIDTLWKAWIDAMPGAQNKIYVTGEVRTGAANEVPKLTMAVPQGVNPNILVLDLSIQDSGDRGIQLVAFRAARFERESGSHHYSRVEIRYGKQHTTIDVTQVH
ncbi:MAG: hypothetical protein ACTHLP_00525 [Rhizobiaceae bacterium]|jgi:hypothetical protein